MPIYSLLLVSVTLVLAACSPTAVPVPTATSPLAAATATLRPAGSYIEGDTPYLNGTFLFVEYFVVNDATSPTSECPDAAMIDFPGYDFYQGVLSTSPMPWPPPEGTIGLLGFGQANAGAMGGGISSRLEAIGRLPFSFPYDLAIIHALDATGEIVLEIQGSSYLLAPGQSWVNLDEWDSEGCHHIASTRLTNHGLLDADRIHE